jgi:predicted membrane-bound spermidine synthase
LLSTLVIGAPTFLMGGTLPAAARAVTTPHDQGRGSVGWLYGMNTLGAVMGTVLSTFVFLELLGTRETLGAAAALNLVNALAAWRLSRRWKPLANELPESQAATRRKPEKKAREAAAPVLAAPELNNQAAAAPRLIYMAAGIVGFAFFLMELIWYRMLGPILGGTTFTFGLILAVALAGIGIGGALYPLLYRRRVPTLRDFALTCGWEALAIAVPFALGDRLAILAFVLQGLRYFGFAGQTFGWLVVAGIVVFPAAVLAGIQFPLLIALLGRGTRDIGRQVGQAFAWNTVGAIAGSLAGGFGLLPLLTAPQAWKLVVIVLAVLALAALWAAYRELQLQEPKNQRTKSSEFARPRFFGSSDLRYFGISMLHPLAVTAAAAVCLLALGPTAVWRHSAIGAGRTRLPPALSATRNEIVAWMHDRRRNIAWEADGREVSVGIATMGGVAFLVSGKSDGNAATDAGTQIMFPVLAAMLHADPRESLVIGLGTGESAGWLAVLPSMERVDVVELEPAIAAVAAAAAPLNNNVLNHPKVHLTFNDAREVVQTTRRQYDLIASEPSNPYRAGVASLYTLDFYRLVRARLKPGGLFAQWVQGYEIDIPTVRMVLGTLRTVFPYVEVWETKPGDMLMVCAADPPTYDLARLTERLAMPAYREALRIGWRTQRVEGILAHHLANEKFVSTVAAQEVTDLNTDNQNFLEYRFARTVGVGGGFSTFNLREEARSHGLHRPLRIESGVDWEAVEDYIVDYNAVIGDVPVSVQHYTGRRAERAQALSDFYYYNGARVIQHWESLGKPPQDWIELYALAFSYAQQGDEKARPLIERLRAASPTEALILDALLLHQQDRTTEAGPLLAKAFTALRADATLHPRLSEPACKLAAQIVEKDPQQAPQLYESLSRPFAVYLFNERRQLTRCLIAQRISPQATAAAVADLEPHVPWDAQFLQMRLDAYKAANSPLLQRARRDVAKFNRGTHDVRLILQQ